MKTLQTRKKKIDLEDEQNPEVWRAESACSWYPRGRTCAQNLESEQSPSGPCAGCAWRDVGKAGPCKEEEERENG